MSEAHRAMWYTSGTLEPNPRESICDCIMPYSKIRNHQRPTRIQQVVRFGVKNMCPDLYTAETQSKKCNKSVSLKNSNLQNCDNGNTHVLISSSLHAVQPAGKPAVARRHTHCFMHARLPCTFPLARQHAAVPKNKNNNKPCEKCCVEKIKGMWFCCTSAKFCKCPAT